MAFVVQLHLDDDDDACGGDCGSDYIGDDLDDDDDYDDDGTDGGSSHRSYGCTFTILNIGYYYCCCCCR